MRQSTLSFIAAACGIAHSIAAYLTLGMILSPLIALLGGLCFLAAGVGHLRSGN